MTRCTEHSTPPPAPPDGVLPCGCTTDVVERLFADAGLRMDAGRELWATIDAHLTPHLGPLEGVLHTSAGLDDPTSGCVSEILVHAASDARPTIDIATVGMSRKRMRLPRVLRRQRAVPRAELILRLPRDWAMTPTVSETLCGDGAWALLLLRLLAQLPHEVRSYLGDARGLDMRHRAVPLENVPEIPLDAVLVTDPARLGSPIPVLERAHRDHPAGRGSVRFLTVVPVFRSEFEYGLTRGADRLVKALTAAGVDDVVRLDRRPVV